MSAGKVLLVDSDPAERAALSFALELEGFEVEAFPNGAAVEDKADLGSACLLLDHRQAHDTGLSFLANLRGRGVKAPAAVMVTNPTRSLRHLAERTSATLIEKPLLDDALPNLLRQLIKSGRSSGVLAS